MGVVCSKCGRELKLYDYVKRILRTKGRETSQITIRRMRGVIVVIQYIGIAGFCPSI